MRQFVEKGFGIVQESKLSPRFQALFQFASQTLDGFTVRTAALYTCAFGFAVFSAAKTSGLWIDSLPLFHVKHCDKIEAANNECFT
ncbi:MAG: hypothetical protein IKM26_06820 [Clostridia bacterium]|nr:hypothetical protein [Clostridia bacterium]